MGDPPVEFVWHDGPVPPGLLVTQVYGWLLCPVSGRVLIQEQDDGTFSLPGGTPEPFDAGRLNRRYMTSLAAAPAVLGWGQPAEAQARAAAEAGRRWGLPVDRPATPGYE